VLRRRLDTRDYEVKFTIKPGTHWRKVEFNAVDFVEYRRSRPCRFGPVNTLATKSTVSATKSTATSCRIQDVADLLPKLATKSKGQRSKVKEIIVLIKARSFLDELNLEHSTS